ncbi:unknown [Clostridium sp. CAG:967]|nr:unknown [Clostridium sp. CAG:967]
MQKLFLTSNNNIDKAAQIVNNNNVKHGIIRRLEMIVSRSIKVAPPPKNTQTARG